MKQKGLAKSAREFDRRFDEGEDVHALLDMEKATVTRPGKKVRLTIAFNLRIQELKRQAAGPQA